MKTFLAVYMGSESAMSEWHKLDEATRKSREQEGMNKWGQWANEHKNAIVDGGAPLGKTKRVSKKGIEDTKNELAAYTVVRANSYDEAAKMFLNHPHFSLFPGHSVEIMECLPIPGM